MELDQETEQTNQKLLQGVQGDGFLEKSPPGRRRQSNVAVAAHQNLKEKNYWHHRLSGDLVKTVFPYDYAKPAHGHIPIRSIKHETFNFDITGELYTRIEKLSGGSTHIMHMILTAGLVILLEKYSGNRDIIIGTPIYKQETQTELVNTVIPLRIQLGDRETFKELLVQVRQTIIEANKNYGYPVEILAEQLVKPYTPGEDFPLFDVVILEENIHDKSYTQHIRTNSNFYFRAGEHCIEANLEYNPALYSETTIERLALHFRRVLEKALANLEIGESALEILSEEERKRLLVELNDTGIGYPAHRTIHELFKDQAERTPDHIAVIGKNPGAASRKLGNRETRREIPQSKTRDPHQEEWSAYDISITYNKLDEQSQRLSNLLKAKGLRPETIAALMMKPSLEMLIAIWAIWKAGGAYLPVHPGNPPQRIGQILKDSSPILVLTREELVKELSYISLQGFETTNLKLSVTAPRPRVKDLDSLQKPDRSSIDYEKYRPYIGQAAAKNSITLQFSRGCVYHCAFCFKVWGGQYVVRSAENLFEEMLFYYNLGIRRYAFVDDLPNLNVENSTRLYRLIIKNRLDVHLHFPNGIRGDILTREQIDLMVEAGTVCMDLALETTSPRLQKLIHKNLNLERLYENIEYIIKNHPQVILELQILHGIPTETQEEARASLDFIKNLKWVHFPYIHVLNIYPHSDMAQIAMEHGISRQAIERSANLAYHELPETLPFPHSFSRKYQMEFVQEYFLSRERLLAVLPNQMKVLTRDELVQKYNSYLPMEIKCCKDLLNQAGIKEEEITGEFLPDEFGEVPGLNRELKRHFIQEPPAKNALRILLLDLTQYFTHESKMIYDVVEPPLGLMYILTHLQRKFPGKILGKIAKSRIDFDSFDQLEILVREFDPQVIGVRGMNFYRDFFHKTISLIREWKPGVPVIAGGPYATADYRTLLKDRKIDLAVLGEGEVTFAELIKHIIENNNRLPGEQILKQVPGIAIVEGQEKPGRQRNNREILFLDRMPEPWPGETAAALPIPAQPRDLAYIIYTSGTSGQPKGTPVQHNNLVNQVFGLQKRFGLESSIHYVLLAAFTFDVSLMHICLPLITGAKLFLLDEPTRKDPAKLWKFIAGKQIDLLNIVPAYMEVLLPTVDPRGIHLKYLFVGGDVFTPRLLEKLKTTFEVGEIINIYGPTETTINATLHRCTGKETGAAIPIGKPLFNYRVYILDGSMRLVPMGTPGELCISGEGVARGYLNQPELTNEKFCRWPGGALFKKTAPPNPPRKNFLLNQYLPEGRHHLTLNTQQLTLYKTGDLARWLLSGSIEFLGRKDQQVKIRGYRIEPGEIRNQLTRHHQIKDAVVIAGQEKNGDKYLAAYLEAQNKEKLDISNMRTYLSGVIPDYMIPAYMIQVDRIPLTLSGKVDHQALSGIRLMKPEEEYTAPGDEIEVKLTEIWSQVLGIDKNYIGIHDNFFKLGGHSLKAVILISGIQKELEVKVPLVEIFKSPTVKELGLYIKTAVKAKHVPIRPAEKKDYYICSPAQKRMYILQQIAPGGTTYNLPAIMVLEGSLEEDRIQETFNRLITRHESFRTSIREVENEPVQRIYDKVAFGIERKAEGKEEREQEIDDRTSARQVYEFIRPFDLTRAPLLRVGLIKQKETINLLMVDMHHIITDGRSMDLLIEEFKELYAGKERPALALQYKDYAEWQRSKTQREALQQQEAYWHKQIRDEIPVIQLPLDYARPLVQDFAGKTIGFSIGEKQTEALKNLAAAEKTTLYQVGLAVFYVLLSKLSGSEDIIVGTPTAGRRHVDLRQIIGMFVNTLALRNYPIGDKTFLALLQEIKNTTIEGFENQEYPFEELVERHETGVKRDTARNPLFDVMFTLDNLEIHSLVIPGLKMHPHPFENRTAKFDLTLAAVERKENLLFQIEYCTKLFKKETIERMMGNIKNIISAVLEDKHRKLADIEILSAEEKNRLLRDMNQPGREYPTDKRLDELFARQAEKTPDYMALTGPKLQITNYKLQTKNKIQITNYKQSGAPWENYKLQITNYKQSGALRADVDAIGEEAVPDVGAALRGCPVPDDGPVQPVRLVQPVRPVRLDQPVQLTYREIDEQSDCQAYTLQEQGVKPGTIVAIMEARTIGIIVGILGILKAGGVYMPIDPGYPQDRIDFMLKDSSAKIVLTEEELNGEGFVISHSSSVIGEPKRAVISHLSLVISNPNLSTNDRFTNDQCPMTNDRLAYLIYTSGTTGKPKSVAVTHTNLSPLLHWGYDRLGIEPGNRTVQNLSLNFDWSVWEIFITLTTGAGLYMIPGELLFDTQAYIEFIYRNGITVLHMTPTQYRTLVERGQKLETLKYLLIGAEKLTLDLAGRSLDTVKEDCRVFNMYGPTEAAIISSALEIHRHDLDGYKELTGIPIGKPVGNMRLLVLDRYLNLCPVRVAGELYISGSGVAPGYLNNPELTGEKFKIKVTFNKKFLEVSEPFFKKVLTYHSPFTIHHSTTHHSPIYKTGDLVRRHQDGNIEFLGRIDQQVKIRGIRVELGEIRSLLLKHEEIEEAVVTLIDELGEKAMCAYFTGKPGINVTGIRHFLLGRIPDYMVPTHFIQLEQIPITASGKIDIRALPKPEGTRPHLETTYVEPQTYHQQLIAETWKKVLGKDIVGIDDNFFDLGGNSMAFVTVRNRLKEKLEKEIPIIAMFTYPTIRTLESYLDRKPGEDKQELSEERSGLIDEGKNLMLRRLDKKDKS